ncbi:DUF6670 family protein [Nocardioides sp. R1-1]|uniref:DUF6670 family protein n=1 Tax=Nocardioides sp. R1-1 TaxID=3383502 RepID=UPI0038D12D04
MTSLLPRVNRGPALSARPFDAPEQLVPHTAGRGYAWSHNGVMIPNLPAPIRFLSMTTGVGASGAPISDILHRPHHVGGPRNRAAVNVSSAATAPGFWRDYRIDTECTLARDGSLLTFGEDVALRGRYPDYHLTTSTPGLDVDVELRCSDVVTWFVHTPVYRHLSLLTHYDGTVTHDGVVHRVSGECAFEHARAMGPYTVTARELRHPWLRMALDFFTYHVIDLNDGRQLLLARVDAEGRIAMSAAFLRSPGGTSRALVDGVDFAVEEYLPDMAVTPDGAPMRLPARFSWRTTSSSPVDIHIEGAVDTPFSWGLGNGYVGGFSFTGSADGSAVAGDTGYVEYIDRRGWRRHAPSQGGRSSGS